MQSISQVFVDRSPQTWLFRLVVLSVIVAFLALCLTMPALAQTKYVITDGDNVIVCMSSSSDPAEVIQEAGLRLGEDDIYTTADKDGVAEIHIKRVQMITIQDQDSTTVVGTYGGTVADVLQSAQIQVASQDSLSYTPDTVTFDGMTIEITRVRVEHLTYDEFIPFETVYCEDASLEPGQEIVLVEGVQGQIQYEAQIVYENGKEAQRHILSEDELCAPVDRVILQGVDRGMKEQPGQGENAQTDGGLVDDGIHVPGTNLTYVDCLNFRATAYYSPGSWNTTFTGTEAQIGTVAVDPTRIPLGTKMYIVSEDGEYVYGYCKAEDTGGVILGRIVDLYFNTYEQCVAFGNRPVKIYILEYPEA